MELSFLCINVGVMTVAVEINLLIHPYRACLEIDIFIKWGFARKQSQASVLSRNGLACDKHFCALLKFWTVFRAFTGRRLLMQEVASAGGCRCNCNQENVNEIIEKS